MVAKVQIKIPPKTALADVLPDEVATAVARTVFQANGDPQRLQMTEEELHKVLRQAGQTVINTVIAILGGNTRAGPGSH